MIPENNMGMPFNCGALSYRRAHACDVGVATESGEAKHITLHDHPLLRALGLVPLLQPHGIAVHTVGAAQSTLSVQAERKAVIRSYIGITTAQWCVADSATIALHTTPSQPRSTSLVPSVHIAVIRLNRLLASLPELYAIMKTSLPLPNSFTFISGPSKTADIEACMAHGAHGPRAMHLVIIEE